MSESEKFPISAAEFAALLADSFEREDFERAEEIAAIVLSRNDPPVEKCERTTR